MGCLVRAEERYRHRPTIITTNLDYAEWGNFLGNPSLVTAQLSEDRRAVAARAGGLKGSLQSRPGRRAALTLKRFRLARTIDRREKATPCRSGRASFVLIPEDGSHGRPKQPQPRRVQ
jgi:IstB-like ATP binding protein